MRPVAMRPPASVFFLMFTVSGFAGLIYQSIWSHYLKLFLGHAAYAQTLVLAIFMGGMAIGAWLVSRFTRRIRNLLIGYAAAELAIGVMALLFHGVFVAATAWSFDTVLPALGGGAGVDLFKWALASALILPASILLGTTFPLMSGGIMRAYPQSGGRALAMLYFTNSFGAALGVLASGFFLIDRIGLPGAILTAGIMNVALALVVWGLAKRMPPAPGAGALESTTWPTGSASRFGTVILVAALATGAASFIHEITWIRMLSLGLGASTHSFEVMLAAFILGMSAGAYWLRNRLQALDNHAVWLAGVLLAKAVFAVVAIWIYAEVLEFVRWMMEATSRTDAGYSLTTFAGLIASMAVMFPTAFCAGMTLPLATHALTTRGLGEASIGRVYGANTAGCILGAAFATHFGMVALGVKGLTGVGAALDAIVACAVLAAGGVLATRRFAVAGVAAAVAAGAVVFSTSSLDLLRMASGVFRHGTFLSPGDSSVLFYRDGKTATISVIDSDQVRTIRTNGKPDAGIVLDPRRPASEDEPTMAMIAVLPMALRPDAATVANIGFGSGLTTHALLANPALRYVDTIEIEPAMVEAARRFAPYNARAFSDPRSRVHIEDAKTFFASRGERYDIIISEPSNPWVSGVSTLFSEEFYGQVKRHLREDGVLVQWIQSYELNLPLLASIFGALGKHFPDYVVYAWNPGDLYVVASPGGRLPDLDPRVLSHPLVAADLAKLGVRDIDDLRSLRLGSRATLEPLFQSTGVPANSDYFPILDQRAPRSRFRGDQAFELREMRDALEPVLAMLDRHEVRAPLEGLPSLGRTQPPRVERALAAREALDILAGRSVRATPALPPPIRRSALLAHALAPACPGMDALWLQAVTEAMSAISPFLERSDVAPVLDGLRRSPCAASMEEGGTRRLALLDAIVARDAKLMGELARALLEMGVASDRERASFLVSAITSALTLGDPAGARALVTKHGRSLGRKELDRMLVRLAIAHAMWDH